MRTYAFTNEGLNIARESGLADLTEHLINDDLLGPATLLLADDLSPNFYYEPEDVTNMAVTNAWSKVGSTEERFALARGLSIDDKDNWRYSYGIASDTLFESPEIHNLMPSNKNDGLVLSGAIGFEYATFRNACRLLAKSRYREFGFKNFVDSAAFVGAFVLSKIDEGTRKRIFDDRPQLTYNQNGLTHAISVGGSFHGDFRMTSHEFPETSVIAPNNESVEYCAVAETTIGGYHSIERGITFSMILQARNFGGIDSAKQLTSTLLEITSSLANEDGGVEFSVGNFADYGDDTQDDIMNEYYVSTLSRDFTNLNEDDQIVSLSLPYLPGNSYLFETLQNSEGLTFQNRSSKNESAAASITVPANIYPEFFSLLLKQAQDGLGRTGPWQHVNLLQKINQRLSEV